MQMVLLLVMMIRQNFKISATISIQNNYSPRLKQPCSDCCLNYRLQEQGEQLDDIDRKMDEVDTNVEINRALLLDIAKA